MDARTNDRGKRKPSSALRENISARLGKQRPSDLGLNTQR